MDCEVILLVGLCNGAGWVLEDQQTTIVLIGIEKLIELQWDTPEKMFGLITHELGHVYQKQFGTLETEIKTSEDALFWQLYTEGIAMYFEQIIQGDFEHYHQETLAWKTGLYEKLGQLKADFITI